MIASHCGGPPTTPQAADRLEVDYRSIRASETASRNVSELVKLDEPLQRPCVNQFATTTGRQFGF
jgi:hypothetical protein